MEAAQTLAQPNPSADASENTRRCLVLGELLPKNELIRFVVSPDNCVVADLAQNLPGRGLWVTATREAITEAAKKNLFSRAAKTSLKINPDLADQVEQLLRKRCLDFLGLSRRAGIAVLGQPQVEGELKSGRLGLLLLAPDAGSDLSSFRATKDVQMTRYFTRNELGAALGHDQLVYLGLKPHSLTKKLQAAVTQLEKISNNHHIA